MVGNVFDNTAVNLWKSWYPKVPLLIFPGLMDKKAWANVPSINHHPLYQWAGLRGRGSLSLLPSAAERLGPPSTTHQLITAPTCRNKQPLTLTFMPKVNVESPTGYQNPRRHGQNVQTLHSLWSEGFEPWPSHREGAMLTNHCAWKWSMAGYIFHISCSTDVLLIPQSNFSIMSNKG